MRQVQLNDYVYLYVYFYHSTILNKDFKGRPVHFRDERMSGAVEMRQEIKMSSVLSLTTWRVQLNVACKEVTAVTKALFGRGGAYSYIHVLPDEFLLKSTVMTTDFKRNSSGRTRIYEYPPPHPPINALVTALKKVWIDKDKEKLLQ